jgi:hypothetical protein
MHGIRPTKGVEEVDSDGWDEGVGDGKEGGVDSK